MECSVDILTFYFVTCEEIINMRHYDLIHLYMHNITLSYDM